MLKRQRMRIDDFDYTNKSHVYFLTMCARVHAKPFIAEDLARSIIDSLKYIRNRGKMVLYCYCLMPDHLHLSMSPRIGSVSDVISKFKSFTTKLSWDYGIKGKLWQRSYYDHIARKEEDLRKICDYILNNPVRAGLVDNVDEWLYSGLVDELPW